MVTLVKVFLWCQFSLVSVVLNTVERILGKERMGSLMLSLMADPGVQRMAVSIGQAVVVTDRMAHPEAPPRMSTDELAETHGGISEEVAMKRLGSVSWKFWPVVGATIVDVGAYQNPETQDSCIRVTTTTGLVEFSARNLGFAVFENQAGAQ